MRVCHRCTTPYNESGQPGYNNTCARCGMPLHACANCRQFVKRGSVRCLVPEAPPVVDPQASNRCRWFEFITDRTQSATPPPQEPRRGGGKLDADEARQAWDQLFGGS